MAALPRTFRAVRALCTLTCLFSVIQACGGRSDTEDYLFGADGSISQGASSSTTAGRPSGSAGTRNGAAGFGATTSTGGNGNTGATTSTGGNGNTGATSPMGGAVGVAGTGVVQGGAATAGSGFGGASAGAPTAGAAGMPAVVPITCGNQVCDANTQSCCAGLGGFGCIGKNGACNGAVLGCTTNADCAGNGICCISITGDIDAASSCKNRCDNMGTGRDRQLCETAADCQMPFRFCTPTIFGVNICTRRP